MSTIRLGLPLLALLIAAPTLAAQSNDARDGAVLFTDDFERGLAAWRIHGDGVATQDSGDPAHGRVMELSPHGDVAALIANSDRWGATRMEGEMLFPTNVDNYLGFVYNFRERNGRMDFGLVYVKGNDSYLQANPHRDFNVSRLIYPEHRTALAGVSAIVTGRWQRFAIEVVGRACHVYVGGTETPQMTFDHFELDSGAIGLQPRSVGGDVWVDNVRVRRISRLSYSGAPVPAIDYTPDALLRDWQVAGPFDRARDDIARHPSKAAWRPLATDGRGAVITGAVVDTLGPQTVAYFRTQVMADSAKDASLELGTADDLAIWINGRFHWFLARQAAAWFDFFSNPKHAGESIPLPLRPGANDIVIRVRGGVYATGGFFARTQ
jgi:hypothetical protein